MSLVNSVFCDGLFDIDGFEFEFAGEPPRGKGLFLASSRLGRKLEDRTAFFDALRTLACRTNPAKSFFVTAAGVTADRFVRRAGQLFGIPVFSFMLQGSETATLIPENTCLVKPNVGVANLNVDELLIRLAKTVFVAGVHRGGRTCKALCGRLARGQDTRILVDDSMTPAGLRSELMAAGATGWWLYSPAEEHTPGENPLAANARCRIGTTPREDESGKARVVSTICADDIDQSRFLAHWTRRRTGRWPCQSEDSYIDDLIFGSQRADHSPLAALCRILASERLIGSNELTRTSQKVVSFSGVPLGQFSQRRKFRSHLSRWDFEPYGIAIDRQVLKSIGTREVIYGRDDQFAELQFDDQHLFQIAKGKSGEDWTQEQEWRVRGDVDLRIPGKSDAVVFVPDQAAAEIVSPLSRWPVLVLAK